MSLTTLTIDVSRACLDQGGKAPSNCPVAMAAGDAGLVNARAGYRTLAGELDGRTVLAVLPDEATSLIYAIDKGQNPPPSQFKAEFRQSP